MTTNGEEQMDQMTEDKLLAEDEKDDQMDFEINGRAEDLQKLIDYGIDRKVSEELVKIYLTGM